MKINQNGKLEQVESQLKSLNDASSSFKTILDVMRTRALIAAVISTLVIFVVFGFNGFTDWLNICIYACLWYLGIIASEPVFIYSRFKEFKKTSEANEMLTQIKMSISVLSEFCEEERVRSIAKRYININNGITVYRVKNLLNDVRVMLENSKEVIKCDMLLKGESGRV